MGDGGWEPANGEGAGHRACKKLPPGDRGCLEAPDRSPGEMTRGSLRRACRLAIPENADCQGSAGSSGMARHGAKGHGRGTSPRMLTGGRGRRMCWHQGGPKPGTSMVRRFTGRDALDKSAGRTGNWNGRAGNGRTAIRHGGIDGNGLGRAQGTAEPRFSMQLNYLQTAS
jgi:hypothetical protein